MVTPQGPTTEITNEHTLGATRAFPLDAYALTGGQLTLISQAAALLEAHCMAKQGFVMPAFEPPNEAGVVIENRLIERFGVGVLAEVKVFGYDTPLKYFGPQKPASDPSDRDDPVVSSPAYQTALTGSASARPGTPLTLKNGWQVSGGTYSPTSCRGRGYARLGVKDPRQLMIDGGSAAVADIASEADSRTDSDSRALSVTKKWSACMAGSGFSVSDPGEAADTYGPKSKSGPAGKSEAIAAATADVLCKFRTNYFGVMYSVTYAHQKQLIDSGLTALETLAHAHDALLKRANAVVKAG